MKLLFLTFFLCSLAFAKQTFAQSCDYSFVVEAVQPGTSRLGTPADPTPFQGYYKVFLKRNATGVSSSIDVTNLSFLGEFDGGVIDRQATNALNVTLPYASGLVVDPQSKTVAWEYTNGGTLSCPSDKPPVSFTFFNDPTKQLLFYIVVANTPGKQVKWKNQGGTIFICPNCQGNATVSPAAGTLSVTFPNSPPCNNGPNWTFAWAGNSIVAKLNSVPGWNSNSQKSIYAEFNFMPYMNGLSDFDVELGNIPFNFVSHSLYEKTIQPNGSVTVTLQYHLAPSSGSNLPFEILFVVGGRYNQSLGGQVNCTVDSKYGSYNVPNSQWQLCQSAVSAPVTVPGFALCDPGLTIDASPNISSNCQYSVDYTITPIAGPVTVSSLTLEFIVEKTATQPVLVSDLPCSSCWTVSQQTYDARQWWQFNYSYSGTLVINAKKTTTIPLTFTAGCKEFWINKAEAVYAGQMKTCALYDDGSYANEPGHPICSNNIFGLLADGSPNGVALSDFTAKLTSGIPGSTYQLSSTGVSCQKEFSFCVDASQLPFNITSSTNIYPLCGVNMYDVLLIQKELVTPGGFSTPQKIAGDVNRSGFLTGADIVEIRKLILGAIDRFSAVESYEFWTGNFSSYSNSTIWSQPQIVTVTSFPLPLIEFVGLKMGDVSYSCKSCGQKANEFSSVQVDPVQNKGEILVKYRSEDALLGIQAAYTLAGALIAEVDVIPNTAIGMQMSDFYLDQQTNQIRLMWISRDDSQTLNNQDVLFAVRPKTKGKQIQLQQVMEFDNLAINKQEDMFTVASGSVERDQLSKQLTCHFQPNLSADRATLMVQSHADGAATIQFAHASGLSNKLVESQMTVGTNQIPVDLSGMLLGTWFCRVEIGGQVSHTKFQKF